MSVKSLLYGALHNNDNEERKIAERNLVSFRDANLRQFFLECAKITSDEDENELFRQTAGTVLSRSVVLYNPYGAYLWDCIDERSKKQVKHLLLCTLISNSQLSKRAAGNAIASIASIEIVRNEWLDLVTTLVENTNNTEYSIKKTSITTLGFLCQQLKQNGDKLNFDVSSSIFTAIVIGTNRNQRLQVRIASLLALRSSLAFMSEVISHKQYRDHIISILIETITQSQELCELNLQILMQFAKYNFVFLGDYIEAFHDCLQPIIKSNIKISVTAMEFWDTVGTQYIQRRNIAINQNKELPFNPFAPISDTLVPTIIQSLLYIKFEQNNIRDAALKTLSTLAQSCGTQVINIVSTFVSNTVSSPDWKLKQASALAFSALCESQQKQLVETYLIRAFQIFVKLLVDENYYVQQMSMHAFSRFMEFFPAVMLKSEIFEPTLRILLDSLFNPKTVKISEYVCTSLIYMTQGLFQNVNKDCLLLRQPQKLIKPLTQFALKSEQHQKSGGCFITIVNILQNNANHQIAEHYSLHLMDEFRSFLRKNDYDSQIRSYILTALHSSILCLRFRDQNNPDEFLEKSFHFLMDHFRRQHDVDADGLHIISALCEVYKRNFKNYSQRCWPFIVHGLEKKNEASVYKTSLICISSLAKAIESGFKNHLDWVLDVCMKDIKSQSIDRLAKLQIFTTMGDVINACSQFSIRYVGMIIQAIDLGFEGAIQLSKNPKDFEYAQSLKQTMIDFYSLVGSGFSGEVSEPFYNHFPKLIDFVVYTCDKSFSPTVNYLKNCLWLIHDMGFWHVTHFYSKPNKKLIKDQFQRIQVKQTIDLMRPYQMKDPDAKELFQYMNSLKKYL